MFLLHVAILYLYITALQSVDLLIAVQYSETGDLVITITITNYHYPNTTTHIMNLYAWTHKASIIPVDFVKHLSNYAHKILVLDYSN